MTTLLEKHGVEKYPFGTEGELRVTAFELNTPQRSDFRPIEAFFSSPYDSMAS